VRSKTTSGVELWVVVHGTIRGENGSACFTKVATLTDARLCIVPKSDIVAQMLLMYFCAFIEVPFFGTAKRGPLLSSPQTFAFFLEGFHRSEVIYIAVPSPHTPRGGRVSDWA